MPSSSGRSLPRGCGLRYMSSGTTTPGMSGWRVVFNIAPFVVILLSYTLLLLLASGTIDLPEFLEDAIDEVYNLLLDLPSGVLEGIVTVSLLLAHIAVSYIPGFSRGTPGTNIYGPQVNRAGSGNPGLPEQEEA